MACARSPLGSLAEEGPFNQVHAASLAASESKANLGAFIAFGTTLAPSPRFLALTIPSFVRRNRQETGGEKRINRCPDNALCLGIDWATAADARQTRDVQCSVSHEKRSWWKFSPNGLTALNFLPRSRLLKSAGWTRASWRKCHKKAKNDCPRLDSNLPSCGTRISRFQNSLSGGFLSNQRRGFAEPVPRR